MRKPKSVVLKQGAREEDHDHLSCPSFDIYRHTFSDNWVSGLSFARSNLSVA